MENQRNAWIAVVVVVIILVAGAAIWQMNSGPSQDQTTSSTPSGATMILPYGQVTLSLGQTGAYQGISITPVSVAEDSRCATGNQCVWAGTVRVVIRSVVDNDLPRQDTVSLGSTTPVGTFSVSLVTVTPSPRAGEQVSNTDYRFTFDVHESAASGTGLQGKG